MCEFAAYPQSGLKYLAVMLPGQKIACWDEQLRDLAPFHCRLGQGATLIPGAGSACPASRPVYDRGDHGDLLGSGLIGAAGGDGAWHDTGPQLTFSA